MADDAFHRLHVVKAPELEIVGDVHQRFAGLVARPVALAILVDRLEHGDDIGIVFAILAEVAIEHPLRHRHASAAKVGQQFFEQTRRFKRRRQPGVPLRLVLVVAHHRRVLVAQHEFENPVLRRLKPGRLAEYVPKLRVFARRQCVQNLPLVVQLVLNMPHTGEILDGWTQRIPPQVLDSAIQLVNQQLDPQFSDLVLNDEQHLVVVRRIAERHLRGQQLVKLQITRVVIVP